MIKNEWSGVYSRQRSYILQCDFSYMISPDMFREFALDELKGTAKWLKRASYHLDGTGCLPNLGDILKIDEIGMVQWVPGEGTPHGACWTDTYRQILDSGKNAQFMGTPEQFVEVVDLLGSAKGFYYNVGEVEQMPSCLENVWK